MNEHNYIFGPIPSRRLGLSLGVDLIPYKVCTFDCIYCQIGETTLNSIERKSFCDYTHVLAQLQEKLETGIKADYITISGSGEPTLSLDIGKVIDGIKKITAIPVAVLTNGSLLYLADVKKDLQHADLLVPSMDAVLFSDFNKINRPNSLLDIKDILQGLCDIRKWFSGEVRLEIMFVKGVNDSPEHVESMIPFVKKIAPDKIELNTVVRPPAVSGVKAVDDVYLQEVAKKFGAIAKVITPFSGGTSSGQETQKVIIEALKRRPLTMNDLLNITGEKLDKLQKIMDTLVETQAISKKEHFGKIYYLI